MEKPEGKNEKDDDIVGALRESIELQRSSSSTPPASPRLSRIEELSKPAESSMLSSKRETAAKYIDSETDGQEHWVDCPKAIRIKVTVRGDRSKPAIITYHDIGLNHRTCFSGFINFPTLAPIFSRSCLYHIDAPGCHDHAATISTTDLSMDDLITQVQAVVAHFKLPHFLGLGVGAGGTVLLHYATKYGNMLRGLVLISCTARSMGMLDYAYSLGARLFCSERLSETVVNRLIKRYFCEKTRRENTELVETFREELERMNGNNVAAFLKAYSNRSDIRVEKLGVRNMMIVVGKDAYYYDSSINIFSSLDPRTQPTLVEIKDAGNLAQIENPGPMKDSLHYFLYGLGM